MSAPQRYVAHLDLDSFFVSVALLNNPDLKGLPVIVGGSKERGVVTTCSYEARAFGVRSAMPMQKAMQLCPQAILVQGTRGEYSRYSRWVTDIIAAQAPLFEKASIDEFYIDLTGMDKFFDPLQWTMNLRSRIQTETGLPISFGMASNKLVAKIATDQAKPNGYLYVPPGQEKSFLAPLSVKTFGGVGEQTFLKLQAMGIQTIQQVSDTPLAILEKHLGKQGPELWRKAQGISESPVAPYHVAKSVSAETTFEQASADPLFLQEQLVRLLEKAAFELRKDKQLAGCVAVKIRYTNFDTQTKQVSMDYTRRDDEILPLAQDLLHSLHQPGKPLRLLGIRLSELTHHVVQASLFDEGKKKDALYAAVDAVKNKYGKQALQKARTLPKK
ncbi:MAG: DNA polymerase IV [Sphingobacteriia bacterium]|nr:MAG: DNA polymerase IV [Sphingobacteriia bacterium]